jgi:uncharacterized protein YdhG (YjbR/CyaY superfamily)
MTERTKRHLAGLRAERARMQKRLREIEQAISYAEESLAQAGEPVTRRQAEEQAMGTDREPDLVTKSEEDFEESFEEE